LDNGNDQLKANGELGTRKVMYKEENNPAMFGTRNPTYTSKLMIMNQPVHVGNRMFNDSRDPA
jgi:hypothetical protein